MDKDPKRTNLQEDGFRSVRHSARLFIGSILASALIVAICSCIMPIVASQSPRIGTPRESSFHVAAAEPTIASLAPSSGPLGTEVTVIGTNFTTENNTVQFSSTARSFAAGSPVGSQDGMRLRFRVTACPSYAPLCPPAFVPAGTYAVTVRNANGTSDASTFVIVSP
jgi:hypothetical protein